jgi:putative methyltransferase
MPQPKKHRTVLQNIPHASQSSGGQKRKRDRVPSPQPSKKPKAICWQCKSIIDQQASEALSRIINACNNKANGVTIKSLTLAPHIVHKKPTFAVTCETLKREF